MRTKKKIDFFRLFSYLFFGACALFLYFIGDNAEPFPLCLLFAMLSVGLSPLPSAILVVLPSLLSRSPLLVLVYLGQATLLLVANFVQKRLVGQRLKKSGIILMLGLILALALFVLAAPFQAYALPFRAALFARPLVQKVLVAAVLLLLAAVFCVALRVLIKKFLRCRLRNDETVFTVFALTLVGVGICRFLGLNAYMGISIFLLLLFSCAVKDATALLCAFVLSLPPLLVCGQSPERFFLYGVAVSVFMRSGRASAACAVLAVFFGYGYFEGLYSYETARLIRSVLSALLPVILFLSLPNAFIKEMENRFLYYRERHLSRIAINRNRAAVGEQLFEISAVFREIQATFTALDTTEAETAAKAGMRDTVLEQTCQKCPGREECEKKSVLSAFDSLVEVGSKKGRVSLIDIPKSIAENCSYQSDILYALNRQLGDYQRYLLETENTASGRNLLAGQAQGVSEILKNLALEQSEPMRVYTDKERALSNALLGVGIVCSELLIYGGEEDISLSLITFGRADVKQIAAVASYVLDCPMIISERIALSGDKFCCILKKKAYFDAAFGVATRKKDGECANGDTHSVIKIDERRFMVALSDGMGSGEYARKISESTVSLLESFYRAKMPSDLVLSTVNKLLTFRKEESFTCVDVAIVDLDGGKADIVKIGTPAAFILSGNTVKVLESSSLPLGILDTLRPDTATHVLAENDVLLFLSDGITDAFPSPADLYDVLRSIPFQNPQELADSLLEKSLRAYGGVAKDDMTAVAVRLFKEKDAA